MNKHFWHVKAQASEPVRLELRSTEALKQLQASIETFPEDYSETTKLRCAKELARRDRITAKKVLEDHAGVLERLAKESE